MYEKNKIFMFVEWDPGDIAELVGMCWYYAPKSVHRYITGFYLENKIYDSKHRELWCCFFACITLKLERWRGIWFDRKRMVSFIF